MGRGSFWWAAPTKNTLEAVLENESQLILSQISPIERPSYPIQSRKLSKTSRSRARHLSPGFLKYNQPDSAGPLISSAGRRRRFIVPRAFPGGGKIRAGRATKVTELNNGKARPAFSLKGKAALGLNTIY